MKPRSFLCSRWVRIPLAVLILVTLLAGGFVLYRLSTSIPGMYHPGGTTLTGIEAVSDGPAEILVYTSLRPSNWDVYLFDELGAAPRRLTDHPNLDYNAVLSPDGRWVVFVSERDGNANLYALDLGSHGEPVALTSHPGMDDAPTLSPDGDRLAFVSTRSGNPDIFVMPFAPGDMDAEAQVVNLTNAPHGDFNPAFSPDGSRLSFSSNRRFFNRWNPLRLVPLSAAMTDIYVMDADGGNLRRVISEVGISGSPVWTDSGNGLLYYKATGPTESGIYRTDLDGGKARRLTPDTLIAITPAAGPEGDVLFVGIERSEVPAEQAALDRHGGRLYRLADGEARLEAISGVERMYLAPHFDEGSGRLVCHGDSPVEERLRMANGTPFTWPGAVRSVRLPDRGLELHTLRSYFPSIAEDTDRAVAVQWVHEHKGVPPGPSALVSARLDGTDLKPLYPPPDSSFLWTPVVSRDGGWIFFSAGPRFAPPDTDVDIWKVRTDGTGAVNLTPDSEANDAFPDVSADGSRLVFRSGRTGNMEIFAMNADGSALRQVSKGAGRATMPAISPDGSRVVYTTSGAGNGMKLWIQSLDDPTDEGRLLEPERAELGGLDMHPRFSPDGQWVVFTSDRAGFMDEWFLSGLFPQPYGELFAVPADGSGPAVRLTHDKWEDALPYWGGAPAERTLSFQARPLDVR